MYGANLKKIYQINFCLQVLKISFFRKIYKYTTLGTM